MSLNAPLIQSSDRQRCFLSTFCHLLDTGAASLRQATHSASDVDKHSVDSVISVFRTSWFVFSWLDEKEKDDSNKWIKVGGSERCSLVVWFLSLISSINDEDEHCNLATTTKNLLTDCKQRSTCVFVSVCLWLCTHGQWFRQRCTSLAVMFVSERIYCSLLEWHCGKTNRRKEGHFLLLEQGWEKKVERKRKARDHGLFGPVSGNIGGVLSSSRQ